MKGLIVTKFIFAYEYAPLNLFVYQFAVFVEGQFDLNSLETYTWSHDHFSAEIGILAFILIINT